MTGYSIRVHIIRSGLKMVSWSLTGLKFRRLENFWGFLDITTSILHRKKIELTNVDNAVSIQAAQREFFVTRVCVGLS